MTSPGNSENVLKNVLAYNRDSTMSRFQRVILSFQCGHAISSQQLRYQTCSAHPPHSDFPSCKKEIAAQIQVRSESVCHVDWRGRRCGCKVQVARELDRGRFPTIEARGVSWLRLMDQIKQRSPTPLSPVFNVGMAADVRAASAHCVMCYQH